MQSSAWIELLRLVPEKQHQNLLVLTAIGNEIAVQDIVRMEPDYLVVRGRLAGTSDLGRAFFIPFDRIVYIGYQKVVPQAELYGLYGATPPERKPEARPTVEEAAKENEQATPAEARSGAGVHATPSRGINRMELLQRIEARAQQSANGPRFP